MNQSLRKLIDLASKVQMTPQQKEKQRLSFAYGNAKIENDLITTEMVKEAAAEIIKQQKNSKK